MNTIITRHFLPTLLRQVWEQHFKPIYAMQDDQRVFFDTPEDMLQAMGMYNLTQHTCEEHMKVRPCAAHAMPKVHWWHSVRAHRSCGCFFAMHDEQKVVQCNCDKGDVFGCAQELPWRGSTGMQALLHTHSP